jgi:solute carrier family 25 (adenine nucleotide translocator) protein 4/5/6/31
VYIEIASEQGVLAFWRGNNANLYKTWSQMMLKMLFYDKIKNYLMPYSAHKYTGIDFFWRAAASGTACMALTTLLTYPFDLIHTRICSDLTKRGQPRLFRTTFDCFNRTNIDEGRNGLYKGAQISLITGILRGALTLPVYDAFKKYQPQNKDSFLGNFWYKLGPSVITSLLLSLVLYPLDTVKKNL